MSLPNLLPLLFVETTLSTNPLLAQAQTTILQSVVSELKEMGIVLDTANEPKVFSNDPPKGKKIPDWKIRKPIAVAITQDGDVIENFKDTIIIVLLTSYRTNNDTAAYVELVCWLGPQDYWQALSGLNQELDKFKKSLYFSLRELETFQEKDELIDFLDSTINEFVSTAKDLYDNFVNRTTLFYNVDTKELTAE